MKHIRVLLFLTISLSLLGSVWSLTAQLPSDTNSKRAASRRFKPQEPGKPSPDVLGYWQALQSRSENAVAVKWNKRSGTPSSIFGKLLSPVKGSTEASARSFLQSNSPLFKLNNDTSDLKLSRASESLIGQDYVFQQNYKDIPVYGAQIGVHFDQSGDIVAINNTYEPNIQLPSIEPHVSKDSALGNAQQAVKRAGGPDATLELVVYGVESSFYLAWHVVVPTDGPTWETFIDAQNGKLLSAPEDINRYVNGTGQVFRVNAVVATHDNSLRDNSDSASAVPFSAYSLVTLEGLLGNGNLDGTFASSSWTKKRVFNAANSFTFDRSDDGLSETMGYYYIDYAERYIQSLGFTNVNNRQQVFGVNRMKIDNSFYTPNNQQISYGLGGVDDAEDAEVILHEYGHSIQDNQVPGFGRTEEGGAMGEGFGDYWSASVNAQFSGGFQDVCLAEWDATSYSNTNPPCLRRLDGTKHYPEDVDGEVHDDGEIWSAALWQIRGAIGATDADRLVITSHFLLAADASFNDGANALVTAAKSLGLGNRQLNQIRSILSNRGFTISV